MIEAPVPTLLSQVIYYIYFYTLLIMQNFSLLPGHTTPFYSSMTPWSRMSFLLLCPSSLTSNALSSLKLSKTHPVCPLDPIIIPMLYYLFTWTLTIQSNNKETMSLEKKNRADGLVQKFRMDLRHLQGYNKRGSNSKETPVVINLEDWTKQFP